MKPPHPLSPRRDPEPSTRVGSREPTPVECWLVRRALAAHGSPPIAIVLWNGEELRAPGAAPELRLYMRDRAALRDFFLAPDPRLCDDYVDGRVELDGDLLRLVELLYEADRPAPLFFQPLRRAFGGALVPRSRRRTSGNIHHHYDLGNAFYELWLDERLVYTCAYFPTPEASLEEAQLAKLDHVCRKLALEPGERVVEAGCGWGALALHMAERYGVRVRAFNISHEQIRYAREQARRRGLSDRVEFVEDDYRSIRGRYDAFVSVGMLEHVGRRHYKKLSRVINRCLEPHGRGLIHSIGRARPMPLSPWIERRIFPGAYPPSLREMMAVFEPSNFAALDIENLRLHYARTLEHWLERFEKSRDRVESMFDARFVRAWRLYLVTSVMAFRSGSMQLFQVLFSRAGNGKIPWTRAHVYEAPASAGGA